MFAYLLLLRAGELSWSYSPHAVPEPSEPGEPGLNPLSLNQGNLV